MLTPLYQLACACAVVAHAPPHLPAQLHLAHLTSLAMMGDGASHMLSLLFKLGLFGVFLVSIVDSSFVPLPIPGITDLMVIVLAAQHQNLVLLVLLPTVGSFLGGWFSYQVGQSGGMAFIEKRTPPRIFKRVTRWMESHAILAVALPAILPPPMPLSPFVLAAGALNMSRRKFLTTFTLSRALRHAVALWLGLRYGQQILNLWARFSERYGTPILIGFWTLILISLAIAFVSLYKTSKSVGATIRPRKATARI